MTNSKIGLGTAQFGMPYGISNKVGVPSGVEVQGILRAAYQQDIRTLDTAPSYGYSEESIGRSHDGMEFQIVTKVSSGLATGDEVEAQIVSSVKASLKKLDVPSIYGVLHHRPQELWEEGGKSIARAFARLKEQGIVKKVGVSIYSAADIDRAMEAMPLDIVQVPLNVFDQRLLHSGHLKKLKEAGVEVHARSAFLQGLLLMEPMRLSRFFDPAKDRLIKLRTEADAHGVSVMEIALGFSLRQPDVDRVIVGVPSEDQFWEIIRAANRSRTFDEKLWRDVEQFSWDEERFLNPSQWEKQC